MLLDEFEIDSRMFGLKRRLKLEKELSRRRDIAREGDSQGFTSGAVRRRKESENGSEQDST